MDEQQDNHGAGPRGALSLQALFRRGMREAHERRPLSFYMLLAVPVVLLLALQMLANRENPVQFVFTLSVLFVFFGVIIARAVFDVFEISRRQLRERRAAWQETLGAEEFIMELGARVEEHRLK